MFPPSPIYALQVSQDTLNKILPSDWRAITQLRADIRSNLGDGTGSFLDISFEVERAWMQWVTLIMLPVFMCVVLGTASLFIPPGMAMPRVGISLLALVSVTSMLRKTQESIPAGTTTFLGDFMFINIGTVTYICLVHVWAFYTTRDPGPEAEAASKTIYEWTRSFSGIQLLQPLVIPSISAAAGIVSPHIIWMNVILPGVLMMLQVAIIQYKIGQAVEHVQQAVPPSDSEVIDMQENESLTAAGNTVELHTGEGSDAALEEGSVGIEMSCRDPESKSHV